MTQIFIVQAKWCHCFLVLAISETHISHTLSHILYILHRMETCSARIVAQAEPQSGQDVAGVSVVPGDVFKPSLRFNSGRWERLATEGSGLIRYVCFLFIGCASSQQLQTTDVLTLKSANGRFSHLPAQHRVVFVGTCESRTHNSGEGLRTALATFSAY